MTIKNKRLELFQPFAIWNDSKLVPLSGLVMRMQ